LGSVATSNDYNDLDNLPNLTLYVLNSSLGSVATSNDYNDLDSLPNLAQYAILSTLSTVASTGDYNDLLNLPVIPSNNNFTILGLSDAFDTSNPYGYLRWNAAGSAVVYETTIPSSVITGLATVAFSGSYNDLTDLPVNTLSIKDFIDTADVAVSNGYLRWNSTGTNVVYETSIPSSVVTGLSLVATTGTLTSLNDVTLGTPTLNEYLKYNGTEWVNSNVDYSNLVNVPLTFPADPHTHSYSSLTGIPVVPVNLDDLLDVNAPTPTNGQVLTWNAITSKWVSSAPYGSIDLEDLNNTSNVPVGNGYLRWNTAGTSVIYEENISAENISGLSPVATSGDLDDLQNVDLAGTLDGYILTYELSTQKWKAKINDGGVLGSMTLGDITGVDIVLPALGDFLY
jgi:hypothetical protein